MKPVNHNDRAHALLSASGSSRWLNCTPSARLEDGEPSTETEHTREGTLAHEVSEAKLREDLARLELLMRHEMYNEEMDEYTDMYVGYVLENVSAATSSDPAAHFEIEVRVDLQKYVPEGFGTIDAAVISNGTLHVIDLKYGKGVPVSAVDNSQLKLYALGLLEHYSFMYDIDTVVLHIHQPRLDTISVFDIAAQELLAWGTDHVLPKAAEAFAGTGEQKVGSWCTFCKVRNRCRAMAAEMEKVARHDFADRALLSDEELLEVYSKSDMLIRWLSGIESYMLQQALTGKKWNGFKLVEGRSVRRIVSETDAISALITDGWTESDFMNMKLKGLGDLEKLLGKTGFESVLGRLVEKPEGKPTLVKADDKRPEINLASDFD